MEYDDDGPIAIPLPSHYELAARRLKNVSHQLAVVVALLTDTDTTPEWRAAMDAFAAAGKAAAVLQRAREEGDRR